LAGFIAPGGGYTKADDAARYADDLAEAARRNPCGCFDADTEVLTELGYKPISDIEVGDMVAAKHEVTGEIGYKPVYELLQYENRTFYELSLIGPEGQSTKLDVTDDHPFWVEHVGWVESDDLQPGMLVLDLEGERHGVVSLLPTGVVGKSFNFEVEDFHTYFVSKENLWVHNCPRARPWEGRPTNSQARAEASNNGWTEARGSPVRDSHGQRVFTDGNNYYSADVDSHSGGTWKKFDRRGNRLSTLDRTLEVIGN